MNDIASRKSLAFMGILLILVCITSPAQAQSKCDDTVDTLLHGKPKPLFCQLPEIYTETASDGYVGADGTWTPDGLIDKADIKIECVRSSVPQLSNSEVGVCLMASAIIFAGIPSVSLNEFDIVVWGKTKIIAQHDSPIRDCELQQLVIDFPSNTVTLTSTLTQSGHCEKQREYTEKRLKEAHKPPMKDVEVFTLVHNFGKLYADQGMNPFFHVGK